MVGVGLGHPRERWNPWRFLRSLEHIDTFFVDLVAGDAVTVIQGGWTVILMSRRLDRRERAAVLAHELGHIAGGGGPHQPGMPAGWRAVVARDEERAWRWATERLVPVHDLYRVCEQLDDVGVGVEPHHIADAFDTTEEVAERALTMLRARLQKVA